MPFSTPRFRENIGLATFSNYRIGGIARFFFEPKNEREVAWAVREAKALAAPVFVLGGGTNLLLGDDGFAGLVLKPALGGIAAKRPRGGAVLVEVGAGVSMSDLLAFSINHGLTGLEWAGGLPGTLGGAIRGNAGCFGGETKDVVVAVQSFDTRTMKSVTRTAAACAFTYRDSIFKKKAAREIILTATLRPTPGDKKKIRAAIREKIAYRENHHPLDYPNIGSMFKNVPLARIHPRGSTAYRAALAKGEVAFRGSPFSVKADPFPMVSAAKLIGESGLRGVSFGGAMISAKHPNFVVNALGATAVQVSALLALAKASVHKKFGIELEEEIQRV